MTTRPTTEIDRAKDGYWNSDPVSPTNPGGMDESADGTVAGHVDNFPAAVQAVGVMAQYVGEVADTADAMAFAVGGTVVMRWDVGTADADPGVGAVRGNHATPASMTALHVSTTDADGVTVAALLASWDDSTSASKGALRLSVVGDRTKRTDFRVSGAVVPHTGYVTIPVTFIGSSAVLVAGTGVVLGFVASGDAGASGAPGATYTLPPAAVGTLGGVKVGAGLAVAGDGTLSAPATGITVQQAGVTVLTGATVLNIAQGATVSNVGGVATVAIDLLRSARYWRLRGTAASYNTSNGTYYFDVAEIEFHGTSAASGTKLAVSAAAISSTSGAAATNAFDGSTGTGVASSPGSSGSPQWISADFGSVVSVRSMKIYAQGSANAYFPSQAVIEYSSDNTNWTALATVFPANTFGAYQTLSYLQ